MILRRLGNKKAIAQEIIKHFPKHSIYIEPFFGAGGMFFNKPKARFNVVNDLDSDVFNLFQCVINRKKELEEAFYIMPVHSDLLEYWKKNKEEEPIRKALRFLLISNFTFMGTGDTLRAGGGRDPKAMFYKKINACFDFINDVQFLNKDFEKFIKSIELDNRGFIYCDPPYIQTTNNYEKGFTKEDSLRLFNCLESSGVKFAMSEFNNPFIIEQANKRGLNIITIGERQNLENRRVEILITNYKSNQLQLF